MNRTWTIAAPALATLLLVVGVPLLGWWARRDAPPRCAHDGLAIEPRYRVSIVDEAGNTWEFCSIPCAVNWQKRSGAAVAAVRVTDEETGDALDAGAAWFVRSSVMTNSVTRNRIHAFRRRADAERHAEAFAGEILQGAERPLQASSGVQR